MRRLIFCLLLAAGLCRLGAQTEILWDRWGVPHVTGATAADMYYGYGWSQMSAHADLMLQLYGQARGRAAEYWGGDYLESDRRIHRFGLPEQARLNCRNQPAAFRPYVEAFVRGINDYADQHPEAIDPRNRCVLPVTPDDIFAHALRVIGLEFIAWEDLHDRNGGVPGGSNAIAIAPARSASGNAMLLTNPHLPWWDFYLWFEAQLSSPGFSAYGITLVGMPAMTMAFNDNLGWAFTVNTLDGCDRYRLKRLGKGYELDGKEKALSEKTVKIKILKPDGGYGMEAVRVLSSVHGPVLEGRNGSLIAYRMVGLGNAGIFGEFHRMAAAGDMEAFESALRMLQIPMFNIVYADRAGNILYVFNGNVPRRPGGDYNSWHGVADGSRSDLIWNGTLEYAGLPRVANPPAGFIQNCNDAPWYCTWPPVLNPGDYPAWLAPKSMLLRPQRAVHLILDQPKMSLDQLVGIKMDTGVEAAGRFLDDLLAAADASADTLVRQAAAVLRRWDRQTDTGSRGAVLFTRWFDRLNSTDFRIPWDPDQPINTPAGLKDGSRAASLLGEAARDLLAEQGSMDVAWGDVNRFRMGGRDLPANGGPAEYGIFRTIGFAPDGPVKKAVTGDTYVAAIEFGPNVKAYLSLSYGNATQPGNPHAGDQAVLLSEKKLRPALLTREDISASLEKSENLRMGESK